MKKLLRLHNRSLGQNATSVSTETTLKTAELRFKKCQISMKPFFKTNFFKT